MFKPKNRPLHQPISNVSNLSRLLVTRNGRKEWVEDKKQHRMRETDEQKFSFEKRQQTYDCCSKSSLKLRTTCKGGQQISAYILGASDAPLESVGMRNHQADGIDFAKRASARRQLFFSSMMLSKRPFRGPSREEGKLDYARLCRL